GCKIRRNKIPNSKYFSSPEEAVLIITELLKKEDFKTLACYYNLSNSNVKLSELESGDFFIRKKPPEIAHPAGFWRYKHPFAPGFKFAYCQPAKKDGIYIVQVEITIEQGAGSPAQHGYSYFYMTKSSNGWQLLPENVLEDDIPDLSLPDIEAL
ncbi:MAG: hypothetical protein KAR38_05915, partial [Calditrichia bacterium]|nr:hypothetical protein [Calditrichia bacterium]